MLAQLTLITALAALSLSSPTPAAAPTDSGSCNTGPVQCCNQMQSSSAPLASTLLGLLGVVLGAIDVPVGIACSPITVVGTGAGANCAQQPVCCENNTFNGVIAIGCAPVNINL